MTEDKGEFRQVQEIKETHDEKKDRNDKTGWERKRLREIENYDNKTRE